MTDFLKNYYIDYTNQTQNVTQTYEIDVELYKSDVTSAYDIDVFLSLTTTPKTYSIDTTIVGTDKTSAYDVDCVIREGGGHAYFIDCAFVISSTEYTKTYSLDAIFIAIGDKNYDIDVYISTQTTNNYDIDTMLSKAGELQSYEIDTILSVRPVVNQIFNDGGTLTFKAIAIRENQECAPAVRDIPMASSQHLDTDTYVLKPRVLELQFRCTDDEKDTINAIFNESKMVNIIITPTTATHRWVYTAWLRNKDIEFEYRVEETNIRWWLVTCQFDVRGFNYET